MSTHSDGLVTTGAMQERLAAEVRELHTRRGRPSSRTIAHALGNVSHATVATALSGRRLPKWSVLEGIIGHLGGDLRQFQALWSAAANEREESRSQTEQDFITRYRRRITDYYDRYDIPRHGTERRPPLEDVFVQPRLVTDAPDERAIVLTEFDNDVRHAVVLGAPGAGKTSLCHALMRRHGRDEKLSMPFFVPFRALVDERTSTVRPVVASIARELGNVLQSEVPGSLVSRILTSSRTVVMFDGLDELPDLHLRTNTILAVEMLAKEYPETRIIVTSRQAGYHRAPLDSDTFTTYRLTEFDESQVRQYVRQWFTSQDPASDADDLTREFMQETAELADIRANPALLGTLVSLHTGDRTAWGRLDLYRNAFDALFKQAGVNPEVSSAARSVLPGIAYWFLTQRRTSATLPELVAVAVEKIVERFSDDRDRADDLAHEIIRSYSEQATVLSSVGIAPSGWKEYSFAHRTMMEYLAATQAVRQFNTPEELATSLLPTLSESQWAAMAKIVVQLEDEKFEDGAGRFLARVLADHRTLPRRARISAANFLRECLELVYVRRNLAQAISRLPVATETVGAVRRSGYHGAVACQIAGATYRQLDYWTRVGLIKPSVDLPPGDSRPLYSLEDTLKLKIVKRLLDIGVSLQSVRPAIDHLNAKEVGELADLTLLSDGTDVHEATSPEEIVDLLRTGRAMFAISVGSAWRDVVAAAEDFPFSSGAKVDAAPRGFDSAGGGPVH